LVISNDVTPALAALCAWRWRRNRREGTRTHEKLKDDALALACVLAVLFTDGARAGEWPSDCEEAALPTQDAAYRYRRGRRQGRRVGA
jgi:hypothetical protein